MSLADLTDPAAVLKAIEEADRLGRAAFLRKYGFGRSRTYFLEFEGSLYDSKAIVGAAHGFQHRSRGPLPRTGFSGGEKTVKPRLEALGFAVVERGAPPDAEVTFPAAEEEWHLRPGTSIRRTDLHRLYGGSGQNGIAPSAQSHNVFVFSNPEAGRKFGYLFDGWRDGVFHYTGDGQVGDQRMRGGNLAIRDHAKHGRAVRVFDGVRGMVTYVAQFAHAHPPYYAEAPDRNGDLRQVIVFRLSPLDQIAALERGPTPVVPSSQTIVTEVPIEQHLTDSTLIEESTDSRVAVRREQPLVRSFASFLEKLSHKVTRRRVVPEGEITAIVCDVYDKTANVLYEAKGSGTRNAIRLAIGQLADYARFATDARRAVLLAERPRPDLERLLLSQGIDVVWQTETGFEATPGLDLISKPDHRLSD